MSDDVITRLHRMDAKAAMRSATIAVGKCDFVRAVYKLKQALIFARLAGDLVEVANIEEEIRFFSD